MKTKIVPISYKDYELAQFLFKERYGVDEQLKIKTIDINFSDKTNPKCNNCGHQWNGHSRIQDIFCPQCGGWIREKG